MELWRRVFPGSKEAKRRINSDDRFLRSEQISCILRISWTFIARLQYSPAIRPPRYLKTLRVDTNSPLADSDAEVSDRANFSGEKKRYNETSWRIQMFCEVGHHQSRPKINGGGGEGAAGFSSGLKLRCDPRRKSRAGWITVKLRKLWTHEKFQQKQKLIVHRPKKMHFIWVSMYLAGKYYLGTLVLGGTAILCGHPSHAKV